MSENKAEVGSDNAMADHKAEEGSNPEMEISSASVQLANLAPSEKIMYQGIDKGKSEDVLRGHRPDIEFKSERTRKKNATTKTGTSACLAPGCTTTRKIIISEVEGSGQAHMAKNFERAHIQKNTYWMHPGPYGSSQNHNQMVEVQHHHNIKTPVREVLLEKQLKSKLPQPPKN